MQKLRWIKLKSILLIYTLVIFALFIVIELIMIRNMESSMPDDRNGCYLNLKNAALTEQGILIPLDQLQENVMIDKEINNLFFSWGMRALFYTILIVGGIVMLISSLVVNHYFKKSLQPIDEAVFILNNMTELTTVDRTVFPKEFSDLQDALENVQEKIKFLYADFEHLSSYITHEQKNSLAVLRAIIQNEYLGIEKRATVHLDRMVHNLDDILTLSANVDVLEEVDLAFICGQVADEYRMVYSNLDFSFDEDADLCVAGHELLIRRAVANLVDNAIKYGLDKPITIYVGQQDNCPFVSVKDNGIGISLKQQEKIFENRYRIGNRKKNGYGIGLSLVLHAAELCHGFVWVNSKENQGAEFKIVFSPFTVD